MIEAVVGLLYVIGLVLPFLIFWKVVDFLIEVLDWLLSFF